VSGDPIIYDDKIVWKSWGDIYMYNLSISTKTQITNDKSPESCMWGPAIYGDTTVWSTWNYDIHAYNLSTSKRTQITTDGSVIGIPAVYKDRIVWVGGDIFGNLFMCNLSTATKTQRTQAMH
jgi:beta propeller repeat protein